MWVIADVYVTFQFLFSINEQIIFSMIMEYKKSIV